MKSTATFDKDSKVDYILDKKVVVDDNDNTKTAPEPRMRIRARRNPEKKKKVIKTSKVEPRKLPTRKNLSETKMTVKETKNLYKN